MPERKKIAEARSPGVVQPRKLHRGHWTILDTIVYTIAGAITGSIAGAILGSIAGAILGPIYLTILFGVHDGSLMDLIDYLGFVLPGGIVRQRLIKRTNPQLFF